MSGREDRRAKTDEERRRRRAAAFGEELPEHSRDEDPEAWGDRQLSGGDDERLRREVPPHHG